MDGFFSKASSFLSSQAEHGDMPRNEEETRKHASSGYGDLLATAQSFMGSANPSHGGESGDKGGESHKAPSSGGYGDLLASAQSLMGSTKLSSGGDEDDDDDGAPVDKKEEPHKTRTSSSDSGYGDVYASAQVLMGAAKASRGGGAAADMGEVAGATSNLIGAAVRYGNLEKGAYGEYAHKAQAYLQEYQASHGKTGHKPSSEEKNEEECDAPPKWKHAEAGHGHQDD